MNGTRTDPRILWVTEESPDRGRGGGSIRQSYLFESLAKRFATELLVVGEPDAHVRRVAANVTKLSAGRAPWSETPTARRALELAITVGSAYPLAAYPAFPARRSLRDAIAARAGSSDLVCVEHEALAPLVACRGDQPWVLTLHHLYSGMIAREIEMAPGRRQRWFRERDRVKAIRMERAAARAYDACIACSEEDAASLSSHAPEASTKVSVIPNGVDLEGFPVTPLPPEPTVLFPGILNYRPNVDGIVWFCEQVWPRVKAAAPDATLVIAGRTPADVVTALGRLPGVTVQADVPSMVPLFRAARVVVVPLRIGTGTRLKALEAMAASRVLVGTHVGLEGLGLSDGVNALFADDPERMAEAIGTVLARDDAGRALAQAGRIHVERRFGWDRIGADFVTLISALLEARPLAMRSRSTPSAA